MSVWWPSDLSDAPHRRVTGEEDWRYSCWRFQQLISLGRVYGDPLHLSSGCTLVAPEKAIESLNSRLILSRLIVQRLFQCGFSSDHRTFLVSTHMLFLTNPTASFGEAGWLASCGLA